MNINIRTKEQQYKFKETQHDTLVESDIGAVSFFDTTEDGDMYSLDPSWVDPEEENDASVIWHSALRMAKLAYHRLLEEGIDDTEALLILPVCVCRMLPKDKEAFA